MKEIQTPQLIQVPEDIKAANAARAEEHAAVQAAVEAQAALKRTEIAKGAASVGLEGLGIASPSTQFGTTESYPLRTQGEPISLEDATPQMINHALGATHITEGK